VRARAKTTPPTMWGAVAGPLAVAAGSLLRARRLRLLGLLTTAGYAAAMADIGLRGVVRLRHRGRRVLGGERGLRPRDRDQRAGDGDGRSCLSGLHRHPLHLGGG